MPEIYYKCTCVLLLSAQTLVNISFAYQLYEHKLKEARVEEKNKAKGPLNKARVPLEKKNNGKPPRLYSNGTTMTLIGIVFVCVQCVYIVLV